jgi:hypothetical protein
MVYPDSRLRGGGSLRPASNLVYDHNGVYMVPVGEVLYLIYV